MTDGRLTELMDGGIDGGEGRAPPQPNLERRLETKSLQRFQNLQGVELGKLLSNSALVFRANIV